jgi:hypothetical protein
LGTLGWVDEEIDEEEKAEAKTEETTPSKRLTKKEAKREQEEKERLRCAKKRHQVLLENDRRIQQAPMAVNGTREGLQGTAP